MGSASAVSKTRYLSTTVVFIAICILAYVGTPDPTLYPNAGPWYSVIPPLAAVCLALTTRNIQLSLIVSIIVGGLLVTVPKSPADVTAWGKGFAQGYGYFSAAITDSWNLQILAFPVAMLTMISLVIVGGGLRAIIASMLEKTAGYRSTQMSTAIMGLVVFIDDYANTMFVGTSMRPLSDHFKVSREKLAFIVDATAAPVAGLAFVSTWIGYEVGLFGKVSQSLGLGRDGYSMFFDALGFRFYCVLMIVFVFANILSGKDFGPMARAQKRALEEGKVIADGSTPLASKAFSMLTPDPQAKIKMLTAIIPFGVLFVYLMVGLWLDGGGAAKFAESATSILNPIVWRDVLAASENNARVLMESSLWSLLVAIVCVFVFAGLSFRVVMNTMWAGIKASMIPVIILVLAWCLKSACDGLSTGTYLTSVATGNVSTTWFPLVVFVLAGITAFSTGTSWGTMAILIPTVIPIAFQLDGGEYSIATMICLGAVLDGSILGDHCSPLSDTTIMSSIATSCDHMDHVQTQLPYSLFVGAIALFGGYLPSALGMPSWLAMLICSALIVLFFKTLRGKAVHYAAPNPA